MTATAVIVHGAYGNPNENWFPWLKVRLTELDVSVIVPTFPTPEGQEVKKWLDILDKEVKVFGADLIMVGHSLGPALILRKLEQLNSPIKATFLVSGFVGEIGQPEFDKINANFFSKPFEWKRIRKNCRSFHVYNSDNDPYVPLDKGRELASKLGVDLNIVKGGGHINAAAGYTTFPKLYDDIKAFYKLK